MSPEQLQTFVETLGVEDTVSTSLYSQMLTCQKQINTFSRVWLAALVGGFPAGFVNHRLEAFTTLSWRSTRARQASPVRKNALQGAPQHICFVLAILQVISFDTGSLGRAFSLYLGRLFEISIQAFTQKFIIYVQCLKETYIWDPMTNKSDQRNKKHLDLTHCFNGHVYYIYSNERTIQKGPPININI